MTRVGVFPADRGGCGMYRMVWPARAAAREGLEVLLDGDEDLSKRIMIAWDRPFPSTDEATEWCKPVALANDPELDVAVFQRPLHCKYAPTFRLLREAGVRVVVDVDDNFDRIDPANVAWHAAAERWMRDEEVRAYAAEYGKVRITRKTNTGWKYTPDHLGSQNRLHWRAALREADLITCSTQALADHLRRLNPNVVVIDNFVPESYLDISHPANEKLVVGWTGSVFTHPRDLDEVRAGISRVHREVDFTLRIVGTGNGVKAALGVEPDEVTLWVPIEDYPVEYGRFDIALCPLVDSAFNRSKSRLKGLEAAALGVVPIMSHLPEYDALHKLGVGVIARRPREWERHLRTLLSDDTRRKELREVGYDVARENTVERNGWRWAEAWVG